MLPVVQCLKLHIFFSGVSVCLLHDYGQESKSNLLFHLSKKHKSMSTFLSQKKETE